LSICPGEYKKQNKMENPFSVPGIPDHSDCVTDMGAIKIPGQRKKIFIKNLNSSRISRLKFFWAVFEPGQIYFKKGQSYNSPV